MISRLVDRILMITTALGIGALLLLSGLVVGPHGLLLQANDPVLRVGRPPAESRTIEDAPAQLIEVESKDDRESIAILNCLFLWDCWILSESGEDVLFLCHDEWGEVYATSTSTLRELTENLKRMDVLSDHA